jgi:hypothetical protein
MDKEKSLKTDSPGDQEKSIERDNQGNRVDSQKWLDSPEPRLNDRKPEGGREIEPAHCIIHNPLALMNQQKEQQQSVNGTSPRKIHSNTTKASLWLDSEHEEQEEEEYMYQKKEKTKKKRKTSNTSTAPREKSKESSSSAAWIGYDKDEDEALAEEEDMEAKETECYNNHQLDEERS